MSVSNSLEKINVINNFSSNNDTDSPQNNYIVHSFSGMPNEIIFKIFGYLSSEALREVSIVSKNLGEQAFIHLNSRQKKINYVMGLINRIENPYVNVEARIKLAPKVAKFDQTQARGMLEAANDKNKIVNSTQQMSSRIAVKFLKIDQMQGKKRLQKPDALNIEWRVDDIARLFKIDPKQGMRVFQETIKNTPECSSRSFPMSDWRYIDKRYYTFTKYGKKLVEYNSIKTAEDLFQFIINEIKESKDLPGRLCYFAKSAAQLAKLHPSEKTNLWQMTLKFAKNYLNSDDPDDYSLALEDVARAFSKIFPIEATELYLKAAKLAEQIDEDVSLRVERLKWIAISCSNSNPMVSIDIAKRIEDPYWCCIALLEISKTACKIPLFTPEIEMKLLKEIEVIAQKIEDSSRRNEIFAFIELRRAKIDPINESMHLSNAESIIQKIVNPEDRSFPLMMCVSHYAKKLLIH